MFTNGSTAMELSLAAGAADAADDAGQRLDLRERGYPAAGKFTLACAAQRG